LVSPRYKLTGKKPVSLKQRTETSC